MSEHRPEVEGELEMWEAEDLSNVRRRIRGLILGWI
jgi:hypothetical protein